MTPSTNKTKPARFQFSESLEQVEQIKGKLNPPAPAKVEPAEIKFSDKFKREFDGLATMLIELDDQISIVKTQNQAILSRSDEPASLTLSDDILGDLKDAMISFLADNHRSLTNQMDSAISGIDSKVDKLQGVIAGHSRAIGEVKSKHDEVIRICNSIVSNVYTTQKATRDEVFKSLGDVSKTITQLANEVEVLVVESRELRRTLKK